jgi:peptidoglycan/LPS O-acetylase OafA/YrhL
LNYRADIDGIRAMAVVSVILFHLDFESLSGGYVGVDIFFVISGYLITSLIYTEIKEKKFSYISFYKRRVARLLPALIITLFGVLLFGLLFYDNQSFDNLGKEVLFSSLGMANILFGQGVNYFAQDEAVRPLIHLWSLGVEEQFYFIWPTLLILFLSLKSYRYNLALSFSLLLLLFSLSLAINNIDVEPTKTYFYPQYRFFELLIGVSTAIFLQNNYLNKINTDIKRKELITSIAVALMILPMFMLDKNTPFPSLYTLIPTVGTALFIAYGDKTFISKVFTLKPIVFIGLISYPLYLYHQPIISYLHFFTITKSPIVSLLILFSISTPLAWLTYRYIEIPIRKLAHQKGSQKAYMFSLISSLGILAVSGLLVAKYDGIGERFKVLNPFAYEVSEKSSTTFHKHFNRGFSVSKQNSRILFIGDSVVQHFVYPFSKALGIDPTEIDTITRGGCVLLKGVEFRDPYQLSDISCENLNQKLYSLDKTYDYIVLSQSWSTYDDAILNSKSNNSIEKWKPFITQTLEYIKPMAKKVIIIAQHPEINGTSELKPTIFLSKKEYIDNLNHLKISNIEELQKNRAFFENYKDENITILHPMDIFYRNNKAIVHDTKWSFFSDKHHISKASSEFVIKHLEVQIK